MAATAAAIGIAAPALSAAAGVDAVGVDAVGVDAAEHVALPVTDTVPDLVVPLAHAAQVLLLG